MNVAVLTTILRAIDNVTPVVTKMQRDVSASLGAVKNLIAGALTTAAVATAVKAFADLTGKLTDLGAKTGVSASAMHGFKLVFEQAGVSVDAVASSINQMQARLVSGDGGAVGAMKQLGLNAGDLVRMIPGVPKVNDDQMAQGEGEMKKTSRVNGTSSTLSSRWKGLLTRPEARMTWAE